MEVEKDKIQQTGKPVNIKLQKVTRVQELVVDKRWLNMIRIIQDKIPFGTAEIEFRNGLPYEMRVPKENVRF